MTYLRCCRAAEAAGVRDDVRFQLGNCRDWQPRYTPTLVVVNPPWGNRLLPDEGDGPAMDQPGSVAAISPELQQAWVDLRDFLKVWSAARMCVHL